MIIDDVMAMNIIITYKFCTLQCSTWRNMAGCGSKQRTVRSNYVYRTVKTCKSLKRDVHEQMCCGYKNSTINTYQSTAFAANHLKMVRRRCKHPTRLHIERFAASIYSRPYFSRQSVARFWLRCKLSFSLLRSAIMCLRGARSSFHHPAVPSKTGEPIDLTCSEGRIPLQD